MEKSPHPGAWRHRGSGLGTAPALCQCCPVAATLSAPYLLFGQGTPLGSTGQGRSLQSWGCCRLSPPTGAGIRGWGAPGTALPEAAAPDTLLWVSRAEAPDLWHDRGARHCQHTKNNTSWSSAPTGNFPTAGSTPRVPAEPGPFLKANSSARVEDPQALPVCHPVLPGTGVLGGQAGGGDSLKEPQLGAEKPSGSWEDAEAPVGPGSAGRAGEGLLRGA